MAKPPVAGNDPIEVTLQLLREWPLPMPGSDGDKDDRGRVLIIGGSNEMPGAVILAAIAAMRAGAGKLVVATGASVASLVAQALPEARVIGIRETDEGGLLPGEVARLPSAVDAVLIGPGMQDEPAAAAFTEAALARFSSTPIVLDAAAMSVVLRNASSQHEPHVFSSPVLLTPHAGEMAHLTGVEKETIQGDPATIALDAAAQWNAVIALKGPRTLIATPDSALWQHTGGNAGLAISGSGDTLAGIITGLVGRGASLTQAAAWGVTVHALAGASLAARIGPLGYLARELSGEIPRLLHEIANGQAVTM